MIIDFWKTFIYALRAYVSYVCGELGSTTSKHGGWILADVERKSTELLRRGWFIVLFADKKGVHRTIWFLSIDMMHI